MKTYLVGGAVRDKLLGYPYKEQDWVVVGASPERLISQGFQQVGRDFPVFLHPETREEYALARTERKKGRGYHGFVCDANPNVTLEDDLLRRDLTINAMAMDEEGKLIDPFNGKSDLENKILRHVSMAFTEDPVRVLRVARFAARYYHLGFRVANETRQLMAQMVRDGELEHLVTERVWQEWQRSLVEKNPEMFIKALRACGALAVVFPEIDALFGIAHSDFAEIDAGIRSLTIMQEAVKKTSSTVIRFAAFLYHLDDVDISIKEWPLAMNDVAKINMITRDKLFTRLKIPASFRECARLSARFCYLIHSIQHLDAEIIVAILEHCDAFRRRDIFIGLLEVAKAVFHDTTENVRKWQQVLKVCDEVSAQDVIAKGHTGAAIKTAVHDIRVEKVKALNL